MPEMCNIHSRNICRPDRDGSTVWAIETLKKGREGGFAAPRGTDDSDAFALFDPEVDVLEHRHIGSFGVGESDMGKCDGACELWTKNTPRLIGVGGPEFQEAVEIVCCLS